MYLVSCLDLYKRPQHRETTSILCHSPSDALLAFIDAASDVVAETVCDAVADDVAIAVANAVCSAVELG